jgi:hypothetical protein
MMWEGLVWGARRRGLHWIVWRDVLRGPTVSAGKAERTVFASSSGVEDILRFRLWGDAVLRCTSGADAMKLSD